MTTTNGGYVDSRITQADRIKYAKMCIVNNMDVELAARQMVKDMADHPRFQRAKNPLKLAMNLVGGGGSGDNQEFNLMIFRQALDEVIAERAAQKEVQLTRQVEAQEAVIQSKDSHIVDLNRDIQEAHRRFEVAQEARDEERKHLANELATARNRIDDLSERLAEAQEARYRAEGSLSGVTAGQLKVNRPGCRYGIPAIDMMML